MGRLDEETLKRDETEKKLAAEAQRLSEEAAAVTVGGFNEDQAKLWGIIRDVLRLAETARKYRAEMAGVNLPPKTQNEDAVDVLAELNKAHEEIRNMKRKMQADDITLNTLQHRLKFHDGENTRLHEVCNRAIIEQERLERNKASLEKENLRLVAENGRLSGEISSLRKAPLNLSEKLAKVRDQLRNMAEEIDG